MKELKQSKLNPMKAQFFNIDLLSESEKNQFLYEYNNTFLDYPKEETINTLFENQVEKTPFNVAFQLGAMKVSYKKLKEKSDRFANYLIEKYDIKSGDLVGLMLDREEYLIPALLGIMKIGAAYVPIDPLYPTDRKKEIIKDSKIKLLITRGDLDNFEEVQISFLDLNIEEVAIDSQEIKKIEKIESSNLAYIIYTSGSTGKPKGVMIQHKTLLNYIFWAKNYYFKDEEATMPLYSSISFDLTITSIFAPLLSGNKIVLYEDDKKNVLIEKVIAENLCDTIKLTPSHLKIIKDSEVIKDLIIEGASVKRFIVGGEDLTVSLAKSIHELFKGEVEIYNEYGPTETTVGCMIHKFDAESSTSSVPIGVPINNTQIYLLDSFLKPVPKGILGELYISGDGVGQGYLHNEKLTNQSFIDNPFIEGTKMYKTGDFAKRLNDGTLMFSGRKDDQVKINAFRIELGEIENQLSKHELINQTVVVVKEKEGDKSIVAYYTANEEIDSSNLKSFIAKSLPDYMLPSFFIRLEKMPLTSNGKTDKKALPDPEIKESENYVAASTVTEKKLLKIWSEILKVDQDEISITKNFMEMGGHSIKIILMLNKVSKELNAKVSMNDAFDNLDIRSLAAHIENLQSVDQFNPIKKSEHKEFYPLSSAQKRLYILHEFNPSFLTYNLPKIVKIKGKVNLDQMQTAFTKLIMRHEALRTSFQLVDNNPVQKIEDWIELDLEYFKSTPSRADIIIKEFIRPFDLNNAPLIRIGLIEIEAEEHILMVDQHHIITDGVSESILIKDFMSLYAEENLPELPLQYTDYVEWLQEDEQQKALNKQKDFWLSEFKNEVTTLNLPTDFVRPLVNNQRGASINFDLNSVLTNGLKLLAQKEGVTLYMLMLSVFNVLLGKLGSDEDIIVGSPVSGRQHADLEKMIGVFVNILPIRNFPKELLSFKEFLNSVKTKTIEAFNNQDYPYEQLIDDLELKRDTSHNALFDVMFAYQNFESVELDIAGLNVTPYPIESKVSRLDLSLQIFEGNDNMHLQFEYSTSLFKEETIERFISYFKEIIIAVIKDSNIRLGDIELISEEEKNKLLVDFNDTQSDYPKEETIVSLFELQVQKTPNKVAVVYEGMNLTYSELNQKANQVAHHLNGKYKIKANDVIAVIADRSERTLIALLGILKAGGAYLPIDPMYPKERIDYILDDSGAELIVLDTENEYSTDEKRVVIYLDQIDEQNDSNLIPIANSQDSCYLIYTSGSTGKPKGVRIVHQNVVNFMFGISQNLTVNPDDCMLAVTSTSFDISVLELFWTLCNGIEIVLHPSSISLTGLDRYMAEEDLSVDFSLFFFSSYNNKEKDKYSLLMESVKYADQAGFNAVWTPERHFHEFGGLYPNPSVISSALSMVTEQIELRSGSIVAPLHDPIRIVEEWSVVDNLSNGRVGLSFAAGWNPNDFALAKDSYKNRNKILHDQIEVMKKLWRGETIKRENGLGQEIDLSVYPTPIQKEMPVWITSSGNEETFRSAGASGANLLTHLLGQSIEQLGEKIKIYKEAREKNGFGKDSGKIAVMLHSFIGEDIDEVEKIVEQPFTDYLKTSIGINKLLMDEAGLDAEAIDGEGMKLVLKNAFKRYYQTSSLIGNKSKCSEMVLKLKEIGVDEIACLVDFGVEKSKVLESLKHIKELKELFNTKIRKNHKPITMLQSTPSFIKMSQEGVSSKKLLKSLRTLLLGGESVPYSLVKELGKDITADIYNMYGPTETTVWSSMHKLDLDDKKVSVGKPILNTQIYILNKAMKMVPIGVSGNLFIGGDGLSKGYWKQEKLTDERFVINPFNTKTKIYNTGDIARFNANGTIELIGREDNQVKIRGHRIELGEIEYQLNSHKDILQSVVVCIGENDEKYLAAYYVSDKTLSSEQIRGLLFENLPSYMQPSYLIQLDKLPLTPNGKIDRKELPNPEYLSQETYVAPSNDMEKTLVDIWSEVLDVSKEYISVDKSFFELGGNSLKILKLNALMSERLEWEVSIPEMFRYPSISSLINYKNNPEIDKEIYKEAAENEVSEMENMFTILEKE
ncbi:amino acid adenylation domain-containing protein [Flavobacterium jejuense]|uniref:Amino acid adenylation domain-containing protein n=1 Tax=Flavobacterium jejuense TaxID=1544455 RepID=A0ABX0IRS8_9FLAO|nr:non-ribosomal peptide synthetase [Flavobacterium jejuense]NHN25921.1 amino acid adenylation domain-containing protein [Flavobacterium jejuense]